MEHKILSLCAQILATKDDDAIRPMLVVLQDELHQFIERPRVRLAEFPIVMEPSVGNGLASPGFQHQKTRRRKTTPSPPRLISTQAYEQKVKTLSS